MREYIDIVNNKYLLKEGRDAPLYHGTEIVSSINILNKNVIHANTLHYISKIPYNGVSLTRSINFAKKWGSVIFELDQTLLSYSNKIIPIGVYGSRKSGEGEYEEFVINDIKPLDKYLKSIYIRQKTANRLDNSEHFNTYIDEKHYIKKKDILLNHPLLKII